MERQWRIQPHTSYTREKLTRRLPHVSNVPTASNVNVAGRGRLHLLMSMVMGCFGQTSTSTRIDYVMSGCWLIVGV